MDANTIFEAIATVGFPIVAYGAMFYHMIQQTKAHKEEMKQMIDAITTNTIALTKLEDVIRDLKKG